MTYFKNKIQNAVKINKKEIAFFALLFVSFYIIAMFVPLGFDWKIFFATGNIPSFWPPWAKNIASWLNFPLLITLTLTSIVIRTYRYNKSLLPVLLACLSLPTYWVIHLGNLDGLVLVGILLLPWGVPLVMMKPQVGLFALLAKKTSIIAGIIWFVVSLLIWGFWPLNLLSVANQDKTEWVQNISLFPWGLLIALPLLWFSRGDEDLLMLAGSFATPYIFPYHFILVMPALGRLKGMWMATCWALSWSPLLANWLGARAWHFGNLFALVFWTCLYFANHPLKLPRINKNIRIPA
jgi:hypothetical protein